MGGLIIHPLPPFFPRASKPYGSPSGTTSGVADQAHTNVRDGTEAVVIAHEELIASWRHVLTRGDDDISGRPVGPESSQVAYLHCRNQLILIRTTNRPVNPIHQRHRGMMYPGTGIYECSALPIGRFKDEALAVQSPLSSYFITILCPETQKQAETVTPGPLSLQVRSRGRRRRATTVVRI